MFFSVIVVDETSRPLGKQVWRGCYRDPSRKDASSSGSLACSVFDGVRTCVCQEDACNAAAARFSGVFLQFLVITSLATGARLL